MARGSSRTAGASRDVLVQELVAELDEELDAELDEELDADLAGTADDHACTRVVGAGVLTPS